MAEAHQAVAFSFSVSNEGVDWDVNTEALKAVWKSGIRSWRSYSTRIQNKFHNGIYPARPDSWMSMVVLVFAAAIMGYDLSFGLIAKLETLSQRWMHLGPPQDHMLASVVYAILIWVGGILLRKYTLMTLLSYTGWMYEDRGRISAKTSLWLATVYLLGGKHPKLYSYQGSLPKLPVPDVKDTMRRYLRSVRPLLNDESYERMEKLAKEFESSISGKLQFYLKLKYWWAPNYVSDWWEEYVYLAGRSPIMINSNFYGMDSLLMHPTRCQAARAANIVYGMVQYMRDIDQEELKPIMLNGKVPLCSAQYERQFCTTRIPGLERDVLRHGRDSRHIVVYHAGRYFKCYLAVGDRYLEPIDLEKIFQMILDDKSEPVPGETELAALTAGEREHWAKARNNYFSRGVNKTSLSAIDKAAFFVCLAEEEYDFDAENLDKFAASLLHGKGFDRWFDKSFTLVVFKNGRCGFNAEHSWADAPIMAHLWEYALFKIDIPTGYQSDGHCRGMVSSNVPNPIRLQWEIGPECRTSIDISLSVVNALIKDVDLHMEIHSKFGKGFVKTCKISPDAFIQLALQLAYYRDSSKFCLTYEASMTRLFREGRTETVRSCTMESCEFVKLMEDNSASKADKIAALRKAGNHHQKMCRDAMTGKGIDRHLFTLYVISKYLGVDSPFLKEVLSEPWRLSTSQTPHGQTDIIDLRKHPNWISAGGGFGPVADDGYGVSYIVAGEDRIFFHISSKHSCKQTDSRRFGGRIVQALADIHSLFEK